MLTVEPTGLGTKLCEQKASEWGQRDVWNLVLSGATEEMQESVSAPPALPYLSLVSPHIQ